MGNVIAIEKAECKEKRKQRNEFYQAVAASRPALFKYCRKLTGNPWDAEDLAQETLLMAYGRLAEKHAGIQNIQSYLFKMATNQWISWCRRNRFVSSEGHPEPSYESEMFSAQDSLGALFLHLPPKERVAFVLSEVFESKNEEIAEIMGNTEGAVKAALSRARDKVKSLGSPKARGAKRATPIGHQEVLTQAVKAFNSRDLEGFVKLFAVNAESRGYGCFYETGIEEIKKGSLFFTVNTHEGKPQPAGMQAKMVEIHGEAFFAIFHDGRLDDIWKFSVEEGEILAFDCYYCCPDVLREAAEVLGVEANDHGYWFEQGSSTSY